MQVRQITEKADREKFARSWQDMTRMTLSVPYFDAMLIYGFYIDESLVGGFGLAFGNNMAWPSFADPSCFLEKEFNLKDCLEVNLLWVKPELRRSAMGSIKVWWKVCSVIARQKVDYVTFACEDVPAKATLMRRYDTICSGLLYNGPITKYEGRRMKVWWTTPFKYRFARFLYVKEYLRLFRRDRSRSKALNNSTVVIGEKT